MAYNELPFHNNIFHLLYTKYKLDIHKSNFWGMNKILEGSQNIINVYEDETQTSAAFWNNTDYSYMMYWKGGHTLINNILEQSINDGYNVPFYKRNLPQTENIIVPYKDPLDRFISAYFTSIFKIEHEQLYHLTEFQITYGNYDSVYADTYKHLDDFMKSCTTRNDAEDLGYTEKKKLKVGAFSYDNHFMPIHILLYFALVGRQQRFKIFGYNLDSPQKQYIFTDIIENENIPWTHKKRLLDLQTANNKFIKNVSRDWKRNNPVICSEISEKFLENDYKLISALEKNNIVDNY